MSFQELATRVSHRNTGSSTDEPMPEKLLARVAKDENLHMIFYRNLVTAAVELTPSQTMRVTTEEVIGFEMPGSVVPGFSWPAPRSPTAPRNAPARGLLALSSRDVVRRLSCRHDVQPRRERYEKQAKHTHE